MNHIPASLRIAICGLAALWAIGLMALAMGAPGDIVVAAAVIGTVGGIVEWSNHQSYPAPAAQHVEPASDSTAPPLMPAKIAAGSEIRRKH